MLRIGVSSNIFHGDPNRPLYKGKTLLYLEQSLANWLSSEDSLAYLIPTAVDGSSTLLRDYAWDLDGLVLAGGADVAPENYGEKPLKPEWSGDLVRDRYEIELAKEFMACNKPLLGICRGAQLLNVIFGGSLYQDIDTQMPGAGRHRDPELYDRNFHEVRFEEGSKLSALYGKLGAQVSSIHHQAIKTLGKGLVVEAKSADDGVIEAIRFKDEAPWAMAVQWHPEFHNSDDASLMDGAPLLRTFLERAKDCRA